MSLRIEPHAEPIPGYRLIERLGSGGFGEVWKAEAPGGLFKAIKFVYGELSTDESGESSVAVENSDGARAKQEYKSLGRVKSIHHPYILSLERFDVIGGQLVIVMELADRTLWDRFKECRSQGLPGIPRDELLGYMEETAEALDLMNTQYQLQHLDIKPQNIFLVFNHVKVADFGLVKDLAAHRNEATITGGVTPVYAAPETFDGWLSRQSDQYSLAIVYQELLTGQRPFAGSTMKQLILHHLQSAPDMSLLPNADRPYVARALSKNPDDRYPTCLEFIHLLRKASVTKLSGIDLAGKGSASVATPPPADTTSQHTAGVRGKAGPVKPVEPNFTSEEAFFGNRPQILPSRPERKPEEPPALEATPSTATPLAGPGGKRASTGMSTQELPGILQPALIVGLGKLGVETLAQLRRRLGEEFGPPETMPLLRLVAIDTDAEVIQHASNDSTRFALRANEVILTRLQRPNYYIKPRDGKLPTDNWLNPKLLYRIPREQTNAGVRALGRLAFVDHFRQISKRFEGELQACCAADANDANSTGGLGLRSARPRVYIVTSLTGSTGSGMFLDVAYLLRKLLRAQGQEGAEIVGLFYVPPMRRDGAVTPAILNAYASLVELQHFSQQHSLFSARYETAASAGKDNVSETGPAFDRCILLPLTEPKGKLNDDDNLPMVALAGDFLCRDLTTLLGPAIDEQRRQKLRMSNEWTPGGGPLLQTLGMYRVHWPRHALLEKCARRLCQRLVTRWMSKDAKPIADILRPWTQERWEGLGMRPEQLIERFQRLSEHALQQTPEHLLAEILGPLHQSLCGDKEAKSINTAPVVQTLDRLEKLLGHPVENRAAPGEALEPSTIERTLSDIALVVADECEQKLAELAVTLLEDPAYRLAGAEEALRQFCTIVEQSLRAQETLAKELAEKATLLYQRAQQLIETPLSTVTPATTLWKISLSRSKTAGQAGPSGADLFEVVRTYAKTRYHSLVLANLNRLYLGLRGHLSDQIREVGFCRQRLGELLGLLQPAEVARERKNAAHAGEQVLFPAGCLDLNDAIERCSQEITAEDLLHFDERVQAWIAAHCEALLQVCMGSSTTVKALAPAMLREAETFLDLRLRGASVAAMYLSRKRSQPVDDEESALADDLRQCHDEAVPELGRLAELNEVAVVSLPNDEHGKHLQQKLKKVLPDLKVLLTDRQDEMVFYREIINVQWKNLDLLGPAIQQAYRQRAAADSSALHTREDVLEWQSQAPDRG